MLTAIAIIPSAPVLVPELAGAAAAELVDLRQAVFAAPAALPARWLAIGVGDADEVVDTGTAGTFAGYGVDVRVALSPSSPHLGGSSGSSLVVSDMPLCALITGWVRGEVRPEAVAEVRVFGHDSGADAAVCHGKRLRAELDAVDEAVGLLVVADGAHTLTPAAPGGYDPGSALVQRALDDALATGDTGALARVPMSVQGRVGWQVLSGLAGSGPRSAKELFRGAPYGVGYFVGVWQP